MDIVTNDTTPCGRCGKLPAVIHCDGCRVVLCADCRTFDLWGYGCGHVDTKAFCQSCFKDPAVNPYTGLPNE